MANLPTYRSKRFGKRMRQLRETAGLSLKDASTQLMADPSMINRVENGKRGIQRLHLKTALDVYGVTDERERELMFTLAKALRQQDWWGRLTNVSETTDGFLTLENDCRISRVHEQTLVPGLLQSERYMRALFIRARKDASRLEYSSELRMKRKHRLDDPDFTLQTVIDVNALHRMGGDPRLRREQLEDLLEANERPNVSIQVLPRDLAWFPDQYGSFNIFTLDPDWPGDIVWAETLAGGIALEQDDEVALYRRTWDDLTALAMSPPDSCQYIRTLLEKDRA